MTLQRINQIAKATINPLTAGYRSSNSLNTNFDAIGAALENTLSRDGTGPNQMEAVLDMNEYRIINLPAPASDNDPVRQVDLEDLEVVLAAGAALRENNLDDLGDPEEALSNLAVVQSGTGAVSRSASSKLAEIVSVFDFIPVAEQAAITAGTSTTDVTTYIQAAMDAHLKVHFPDGYFKITDQLEPRAGQTLVMSPGTILEQHTTDTPIFYALTKDDLTFDLNGAMVKGEGAWSALWTGSGGHNDRGIYLIDCDRFRINRGRIRNCALSGITIWGGSDGEINNVRIEGTTGYGADIPSEGNFQMGIYLMGSAPYGAHNGLKIDGFEASGSAHGLLAELPSTGTQPTRPPHITRANIHDIPGQHAFYCQFPVKIDGALLTNIELAGVKLQSTTDNDQDIRGFVARGIEGRTVGSSLFEIAQINGTADLTGIDLQGVGVDVGVGLSTSGRVQGVAELNIDGCDSVVIMAGAGTNFDVHAKAKGTNNDAFIITATDSTINVWPDVTDVRQTAGDANSAAFNIASATAVVNVYDPKITAASGSHMKYALTNKVAGGVVTVQGQPTISGQATALLLETEKIKYSDWRSWTPTYSASSGTITTVTTNTAKYVYLTPKTIAFDLDVTFTDAGTGSGDFMATLPVTAANPFAFAGFDQLTTGVNIVCRVRPADLTKMTVVTQVTGASAGAALDVASTIATGRRIIMSGVYQVA